MQKKSSGKLHSDTNPGHPVPPASTAFANHRLTYTLQMSTGSEVPGKDTEQRGDDG